ncbi:putative toxin-antitoxin system toxin component, PIN family [Pedobacter sp. MR2016-19]|uniref:putative toxin-antitoxin system toxin component, PIN family n=1 Tax=Pedobacter sp. MR2016-19 TaxID=2780089 RepID=UPI001876CADD|nr:putative toxin-antitoxin system toxin component, PIN family [Pedobacter sp. MR2016-19]MBE5318088.1 putative toxin-antitoxin system toxin component, PIN family [Pedobacter sp. MR2016-19]
MRNLKSRIILDTNLWISFLISKDFSRLDEIIFSKKSILIFSQELLEEFLEVVKRPKFRRYFAQTDIEELLETIDEYGEFIVVKSRIEICRDAKDNFLLSLAVDGKADFLLTGDQDLLMIEKIGNTNIKTISSFFEDEVNKI